MHELGGSMTDACLRTFPDPQCPRNLKAINRTVIELVGYHTLKNRVKAIPIISSNLISH